MGTIPPYVAQEGALQLRVPCGPGAIRLVLEKNRGRSRTKKDTCMEERRHLQTGGDNPPLTTLGLVDPDRLALFRYGIITWIDKDGFPFSVATDFILSENGEILLKKPSVPATMTGGRVGVLFNHITGVPTGGYTDRRYMLVWGRVSEDKGFLKLRPEEVSEWDEKNLPFHKIIAAAGREGKRVLQSITPSN